jgi:hypothetical protein
MEKQLCEDEREKQMYEEAQAENEVVDRLTLAQQALESSPFYSAMVGREEIAAAEMKAEKREADKRKKRDFDKSFRMRNKACRNLRRRCERAERRYALEIEKIENDGIFRLTGFTVTTDTDYHGVLSKQQQFDLVQYISDSEEVDCPYCRTTEEEPKDSDTNNID